LVSYSSTITVMHGPIYIRSAKYHLHPEVLISLSCAQDLSSLGLFSKTYLAYCLSTDLCLSTALKLYWEVLLHTVKFSFFPDINAETLN